MDGSNSYAVFFFPQALEALGDAIKPYLQDGPGGPHVMCNGIDTAGALIEMNLNGTTADGAQVELELMVPNGMVRMIVSAHSDEMFGFGPHPMKSAVQKLAAVVSDGATPPPASDLPDTQPKPEVEPEPKLSEPKPETEPQPAKKS